MFENPYDILSPEEAMIELQIGKTPSIRFSVQENLKPLK